MIWYVQLENDMTHVRFSALMVSKGPIDQTGQYVGVPLMEREQGANRNADPPVADALGIFSSLLALRS